MHLVFAGVGGVGGYFAARLAHSGLRVSVVARGERGAAIRKNGLTLEGVENFTAEVACFEPGSPLPPFDFLFLGVKCTDLEDLASRLAPSTPSSASVVTLQNGLDAEEICARFFPPAKIVAGIAYIDAFYARPGVIRVDRSGRLAIGENDGKVSPRVQSIQKLFEAAGVTCEVSSEIRRKKWQKLAWNAVFNPLCTLTRHTVREIVADASLREVGEILLAELRSVARSEGIEIESDLGEKIFAHSAESTTRTSMWADFSAGKPTEIDFLNGAISRRGRKQGVPTPVNDTITALVKAAERGRASKLIDASI